MAYNLVFEPMICGGIKDEKRKVGDVALVSSCVSLAQIPSQSDIQIWPTGSQNLR